MNRTFDHGHATRTVNFAVGGLRRRPPAVADSVEGFRDRLLLGAQQNATSPVRIVSLLEETTGIQAGARHRIVLDGHTAAGESFDLLGIELFQIIAAAKEVSEEVRTACAGSVRLLRSYRETHGSILEEPRLQASIAEWVSDATKKEAARIKKQEVFVDDIFFIVSRQGFQDVRFGALLFMEIAALARFNDPRDAAQAVPSLDVQLPPVQRFAVYLRSLFSGGKSIGSSSRQEFEAELEGSSDSWVERLSSPISEATPAILLDVRPNKDEPVEAARTAETPAVAIKPGAERQTASSGLKTIEGFDFALGVATPLGSTATQYAAQSLRTGEPCLVRSYSAKQHPAPLLDRLYSSFGILQKTSSLSRPLILDISRTDSGLHVAHEPPSGTTLLDALAAVTNHYKGNVEQAEFRWRLARGLCDGVVEYHQSGVAHAGLEPMSCRVEDFGSNRERITIELPLEPMGNYVSPLSLAFLPGFARDEQASMALDVLGLSLLIYGIFSDRRYPFDSNERFEAAEAELLRCAGSVGTRLFNALRTAWVDMPESRPSSVEFRELVYSAFDEMRTELLA